MKAPKRFLGEIPQKKVDSALSMVLQVAAGLEMLRGYDLFRSPIAGKEQVFRASIGLTDAEFLSSPVATLIYIWRPEILISGIAEGGETHGRGLAKTAFMHDAHGLVSSADGRLNVLRAQYATKRREVIDQAARLNRLFDELQRQAKLGSVDGVSNTLQSVIKLLQVVGVEMNLSSLRTGAGLMQQTIGVMLQVAGDVEIRRPLKNWLQALARVRENCLTRQYFGWHGFFSIPITGWFAPEKYTGRLEIRVLAKHLVRQAGELNHVFNLQRHEQRRVKKQTNVLQELEKISVN